MQRGLKLQNYKIAKLQNRPARLHDDHADAGPGADHDCAARRAARDWPADPPRPRRGNDAIGVRPYMRAIQHFYRKFGRYPSRVEELENTNNLRFLRKRYTDPMNRDPVTGKERDFKFLHQQDITLNNSPVLQPPTKSFLDQCTAGRAATAGRKHAASARVVIPASPSSGNSFGRRRKLDPPGRRLLLPMFNSGSGFNGPTFGGGPILGVASTSKR